MTAPNRPPEIRTAADVSTALSGIEQRTFGEKALRLIKRLPRPGTWLPFDTIKATSSATAWDLIGNHTPRHFRLKGPDGEEKWVDVPEDLHNDEGDYLVTRSGANVAGRLLTQDLKHGSQSVAVLGVMALVPFVTALFLFLGMEPNTPSTTIFLFWLVLGAAATGLLKKPLGTMPTLVTLGLGMVLPIAGLYASYLFTRGWMWFQGAAGAMAGPIIVVSVLMLAFSLLAVWIIDKRNIRTYRDANGRTVTDNTGVFQSFAEVLAWAIGTPVVLYILNARFPTLQPVLMFMPGLLWPCIYDRLLRRHRAVRLRKQHRKYMGADNLNQAHVVARRNQAIAAINDTTPLIKLGISEGAFVNRGDRYGAMHGQELCMSVLDLMEGLIIFGSIGQGKTSSVIRPIAKQLLEVGVGVALYDDKAELALDCSRLRKDFLLVWHGVEGGIGLFEGLGPAALTQMFEELLSANAGGKDNASGNSQYFLKLTQEIVRHSIQLLWAAVLVELNGLWKQHLQVNALEEDFNPLGMDDDTVPPMAFLAWWKGLNVQRQWTWTWACLDDIVQAMQKEGSPIIDALLKVARQHPHAERACFLLNRALHFVDVRLPELRAGGESNGISAAFSSALNVFSPIQSNQKILHWSQQEFGADITCPLRGGAMGMHLPPSEFGEAGAIVGKLVKQRLYTAVRRRAGGNKDHEPHMFIVMDEAQAILSSRDSDAMGQLRGLKCGFVLATQNREKLDEKFGSTAATDAILDYCRSRIFLKTSAATMQWLQREVGNAPRWVSRMPNQQTIDFPGTAAAAAKFPEYDPTHPDYYLLQSLLKGGDFNEKDDAWDEETEVRKALQGDFHTPVIARTLDKEEAFLINNAIIAWAAVKGYAVACIRRAGADRRDVIKLHHDASPSVQLPKVQHTPHQTSTPPSPAAPTLRYPLDCYTDDADPAREYEVHFGLELDTAIQAQEAGQALTPDQSSLLDDYAAAVAQRAHVQLVKGVVLALRRGVDPLDCIHQLIGASRNLDTQTIKQVIEEATRLAPDSTVFDDDEESPTPPVLYARAA